MIISKGLLVEFVNITNLYGFEIDNNNIKNKYNIFGLKPVGAGRIQIINIVYENNIYKTDDTLKLSIEKMCSDYSKAENRNEITDKFVCEILQYYIGYYISLQTSDSVYGPENNIIYLLEPLYEMIEKSNEWIISFWELLKTSLTNKNNSRFASAIIKDTLKFKHIKLAKYLPNQLCKLAEYFWTYEEYKTKDELYRFNNSYLSTISNSHLWGLNKNSDDYSINNFKNSPITSSFFFNLFITNYFDGLKWSIQFINKLINNYVKNEGDSKSNINLYFVEQNKQNVYYGDTDMWCAGTKLSNVPTIINDIIFCLKEVLFLKLIDEKTNIANKKSLLNQTREIIYEESNNIIMLSVVSDIGKLFHKNFPGYSIDLISSINLVNFDLEKMAGLMPLPLTDKLEKQIFLSVGISNYSDRYKSKINIIFDVRNYAIYCQLQKDITIRKKCYKILDYLYSIIENNDENLNDYFQLEQMDVRKASCKYKGDGFIEVTPNIAMNTSKTFDNYNKIKSEAEIIEESVKSLNVKILDGEYKLKDITDTIETILTHSEDKYLKLNVEATKIELIAFALSDSNLDDNLRNKYCLIWIEGLEDCIQNNTFIFEQKLIPVLIEQTKKRINKNSVRRIEKIILECILRREFSGVINNMYYYIYKYLINNKELVLPLYNTIIALAFEEPKIYKYRHNNDNKYFSKISNIISKYLYDKEPLIHKTISSANYEFDTLFRCFDTGVSLEDQGVYDLARRILKKIINIWNIDKKTFSIENKTILNTSHIFSNFLGLELTKDVDSAKKVLSILFDKINFFSFTDETITFYEEVFAEILYAFAFSYNDSQKREECKEILNLLENKILKVANNEVERSFKRALILSPKHKYFRSDWSKYNFKYSYQDKLFLNKKFCDYGYLYIDEMINAIFKLGYTELLPEVIMSLNASFKKIFKHYSKNPKKIISTIRNNKERILTILYKAYIEYSDDIKQDEDLIKSFESILEIFVNQDYEEFAVILDEFRTH